MAVDSNLTDGVFGPLAAAGVERSGDYEAGTRLRDLRKNSVQVLTLGSFEATDGVTLTFLGEAVVEFVSGTNCAAADIQAALRAHSRIAQYDEYDGLTVTGTEDTGPFTIDFGGSYRGPLPLIEAEITTGAGTATVAAGTVAGIDALGESEGLAPPTAITPTPTDAVDEVVTLDVSADVDGGTFRLAVDGRETDDLAWDAAAATVQTALDTLFADLGRAGDEPTVARVDPAGTEWDFTFTFENGTLAGRPVVGEELSFVLADDSLTDGGVAEASTFSVTTAGVLGSVSIAYTEGSGGESVLVTVVNDTTGEQFDVQVDAASTAVCDGLPVGDYTAVLRTIDGGRVGQAATSTFSIASA